MHAPAKTRGLRIALYALVLVIVLPLLASAAGLVPCGGGGEPECGFCHLIDLVNGVIKFTMLYLVVPLAAIMFAFAGIQYLSSRGDPGKIRRAHDIFGYTFWGIVIVFTAWLIINALAATFLDTSILNSGFWFLGESVCNVGGSTTGGGFDF